MSKRAGVRFRWVLIDVLSVWGAVAPANIVVVVFWTSASVVASAAFVTAFLFRQLVKERTLARLGDI